MSAFNMPSISQFAVVTAAVIGLGMVALGGLFIALGVEARSDVRAALVKEQIVTSSDAPIPGVEGRGDGASPARRH